MSQANRESSRKRTRKAAPVLGAAGLLALASSGSASASVDGVVARNELSHHVLLGEEEVLRAVERRAVSRIRLAAVSRINCSRCVMAQFSCARATGLRARGGGAKLQKVSERWRLSDRVVGFDGRPSNILTIFKQPMRERSRATGGKIWQSARCVDLWRSLTLPVKVRSSPGTRLADASRLASPVRPLPDAFLGCL